MKLGKSALGLVTLAASSWGLAGVASAQTTGAVQIWTATNSNKPSIIITGAIGDYGKAVPVTSTGAPSKKNTGFRLLKLKHGTVLINATAFNKAVSNANPTLNSTNCSYYASVSGPGSGVSGTGSYADITGSVTLTVSFQGILPTKNGSCNQANNAKPLAQEETFTGIGTVSY